MAREHLTEWAKREMTNTALCGENPFSQDILSKLGEVGGAIEKKCDEKGDITFVITPDFMMEVLWAIRNRRERSRLIMENCIALSEGVQGPGDTAN